MPKLVHLEFVVQRLLDGRYAVDLWNKLDGQPMNDSDRYFASREDALRWCESYRPGRFKNRSVSIHE